MNKHLLLALLCFYASSLVFAQSTKKVPFSFNLSQQCRTSAGVYTKDGVLIRTLWSNVSFPAGSYTKTWDGLDDNKQNAAPANYEIRVLSNNVTYTWEGVVGNSSFNVSQSNSMHRGFLSIKGMAIAGQQAYFGNGYAEGNPSQARFALSQPQQRVDFFSRGSTDQATQFVATDGQRVYWAGYDGYENGNTWFIFGTRTADDAEESFASGQSLKMIMGRTYNSCIDVIKESSGRISGLAVQRQGPYLFVSHGDRHQIRVLNKATGVLVQSLFFNDAASLAVDQQDNLWVVDGSSVKKYSVNPNGTLSSPGISLSGLQVPMAIAVSPDNNTVLVADGDNSQQIKAFDNQNGAAKWTLGQPGGYLNDPTVTDNKFYFSDVSKIINNTFIAFQPDGSFWIGDSGNYRVQHYSSNQTFIDRISYLQNNYSCFVDQKNPTRMFAEFLEYKIDYSKPLAANNGSWTLVKNWRASLSANYFEQLSLNHIYITDIFRDVLTMPNGRTYAFLKRFNDSKLIVVELPDTGPLRLTKISFPAQYLYTYHITSDGHLKQSINQLSGSSGKVVWQNRVLNGFDGDNDPIWGPVTPYATAPVANGDEPINWIGGHGRTGETTSSNVMISFDNGKIDGEKGGGYHLGGLSPKTNQWLWKTARATFEKYRGAYPGDGAYDVGNTVEYAGGGVSVYKRHIFWNYHGEFWKNSQVNKWQHVYDNGLLVGVFGKTGIEARIQSPNGAPVPGMAGNVYQGTIVEAPDGNVYLYHNEESGWSGIDRWRVDGLNSIQEQIISLKNLNSYANLDNSSTESIDLLQGLPERSVVSNGTAAWTRSPADEINNVKDQWTVKTRVLTYDRFSSPDLYVNFLKMNDTYTVSRDLKTTAALKTWNLKGVITFDGTIPNEGTLGKSGTGGSYFEVLDNKGKVLVRFFQQVFFDQPNAPVQVFGNGKVIAQGNFYDPATATGTEADSLNIKMENGSITIAYRNYPPVTASAFENGGDITYPNSVRLFFWSNGKDHERTIDIQSLQFTKEVGSGSVVTPVDPVAPINPVAPVTPTSGIVSGSVYTVKAKHSGKLMDVSGVSTANGAKIIQYSATGGKNQQWQLVEQGNGTGYYTLKALHSNKMLDINGGSNADGAIAIQWPANGQNNQRFKLTDVGNGYFTISNSANGKCIEVKDQSTANSATIQQNTCNGNDNQKFYFTLVNTGSRQSAEDFTDKSADSGILIYPNPTADLLTVSGGEGAELTIIDELGKVHLTASSPTNLSKISVAGLAKGVYILQVRKAASVVNKKLLINR